MMKHDVYHDPGFVNPDDCFDEPTEEELAQAEREGVEAMNDDLRVKRQMEENIRTGQLAF